MCKCGCNKCEIKENMIILNKNSKAHTYVSSTLKRYISNNIPLKEHKYCKSSIKYLEVLDEARKLYSRGLLEVKGENKKLLLNKKLSLFEIKNQIQKHKIKQIIKEILIIEVSIDQLKSQFVDSGKLDSKVFDEIVSASNNDSSLATWLTARVAGTKKEPNPSIKAEDVYKWEDYFKIFKRRKQDYPSPDINSYKTSKDIQNFLKVTMDLKNKEKADPSQQKGVQKSDKFAELKIGEVDGYSVYKIPKGAKDMFNVSCELGSGTEWCTSTGKTSNYFNQYISQGPLYIFDNGKGDKYQFHYESEQFMDKDDVSVL